MRALIMAGGAGSRLGRGEKPLVSVCNRPMIEYITDAFLQAGCEPVVVMSPRTPMTANWCRAHGIAVVGTTGEGFIPDMVRTVRHLDEELPVIVSVSDIPCIDAGTIQKVISAYNECGMDALSAWVPARLVKSCRGGMPYRWRVGGVEACPAGLNILRSDCIEDEQPEFSLLLDDPALALNVNTPGDLDRAEAFLMSRNGGNPGRMP